MVYLKRAHWEQEALNYEILRGMNVERRKWNMWNLKRRNACFIRSPGIDPSGLLRFPTFPALGFGGGAGAGANTVGGFTYIFRLNFFKWKISGAVLSFLASRPTAWISLVQSRQRNPCGSAWLSSGVLLRPWLMFGSLQDLFMVFIWCM